MAQPTAYTRATDFSTDELNSVGGRSTVRTANLDAEFDAIATTISQVRAVISLNQRDDGEIRDERVKLLSLSSEVKALLVANATIRGAWLTATAYALRDVVTQGGNTYVCAVAHTSGTFATDLSAVKWLLVCVGSSASASGVPFTPTATIAATNVQAAIDEADTENRAVSAAYDTALRADLSIPNDPSKGAGMVDFDVDTAYPRGCVGFNFIQERKLTRDFGGVNDGSGGVSITANDTAYADAETWMAGGRKVLLIEDGHYKASRALALPSICYQSAIIGHHPGAVTLEQTDNTKNVIQIPAGATCHTLTVEGLRLLGPGYGAGTGHGFYSPAGIEPFGLVFRNLYIEQVPARGMYVLACFQSLWENVQTNYTGSHGIDVPGGNTNLLTNCYAHNLPTAGTAGYRIHGGAPTLINCCGIDSGQYWGIFGDTVVDDGSLQYCRPVLIGCNIEDFSLVGLRNKSGGITLLRTDFVAPAAGTVTAVLVDPSGTLGTLDTDSAIVTKGAAWANGYPVHTSAAGIPFRDVGSSAADQFTWYNELSSVAQKMTTLRQFNIRTNRAALSPLDLYVRGLMRSAYCGTAVLAAGTVTVTFGTAMPDTSYMVTLAGGANETFRWSSKTINGFTITSSNAGSVASVDWSAMLVA